MVDRTPPRWGPKLRYSFDEQRARLLDYDSNASTPTSSPGSVGRSLDVKIGSTRRRRPVAAALSVASLILLVSAGIYRHSASMESLRNEVDDLRAKLGAASGYYDAITGPRADAAEGTARLFEPAAAVIPESSRSSLLQPELHLVTDADELHLNVAQDAPATDIVHDVAPPDDPIESAEGELVGIQTGDTPAAIFDVPEALDVEILPETSPSPRLLQPAPNGFPSFMTSSQFLDTRPRPRPPPRQEMGERYLSYTPHSGFHNQRIEFENALVLAQLLNRTLLVPLVRLGRPQAWMPTPGLQTALEREEKHLLTSCINNIEFLESAKVEGPCENYTDYTEVSWDTLVDLSPLEKRLRLVERTDISRSWFTSKEGLGLSESDIESFEDDFRYAYRFYDSKQDQEATGRYKRRLDVEDLLERPFADKRLLEFGSLFGSSRLKISLPAHRGLGKQADEQMVFRNSLLSNISSEMVAKLGGLDAYIGLHLRVGDGAFARTASKNMQRVFYTLASDVFGLDRKTTKSIYAMGRKKATKGRKDHQRRDWQPSYQLLDSFNADFFRASDASDTGSLHKRAAGMSLRCPGKLHTDPNLLPLNRPVYIATDARHPRSHPDLSVFFNALPCAFVLGDFADLPGLEALETVRSLQEGVRMARFLYPFLEAMMAARSRIATLGTPGSTFSGFAATTLHRIYAHAHEDGKNEIGR